MTIAGTSPLTATSIVNVTMPDGTIRQATTRPCADDDYLALAMGYTHWPHIEGYDIGTTGQSWRAKPSHYIEVFGDHHAPTIRYARVGDDWYTFPALHNGWSQRRPWHPSPAVAGRMSRAENITTFCGQSWLAEEFYGIPRDLVVTYTADQIEAKLAAAA